jgi:hypothetical protein
MSGIPDPYACASVLSFKTAFAAENPTVSPLSDETFLTAIFARICEEI